MAIYKGNKLIAGYGLGYVKAEELEGINVENLHVKNLVVDRISAEKNTDNYYNMNLIATDKSDGSSYNIDIDDLIRKISRQIQEENKNMVNANSNMIDIYSNGEFYSAGLNTMNDLWPTLSAFTKFDTDKHRYEIKFPKNMYIKIYSRPYTDGTYIHVNLNVDRIGSSSMYPTEDQPLEMYVKADTSIYLTRDLNYSGQLTNNQADR